MFFSFNLAYEASVIIEGTNCEFNPTSSGVSLRTNANAARNYGKLDTKTCQLSLCIHTDSTRKPMRAAASSLRLSAEINTSALRLASVTFILSQFALAHRDALQPLMR